MDRSQDWLISWQLYVLPHTRQSMETMTSVSAGHNSWDQLYSLSSYPAPIKAKFKLFSRIFPSWPARFKDNSNWLNKSIIRVFDCSENKLLNVTYFLVAPYFETKIVRNIMFVHSNINIKVHSNTFYEHVKKFLLVISFHLVNISGLNDIHVQKK